METNALAGFASMSTDTSRRSNEADSSWALHNQEAQKDWGYRAMRGSVLLAKSIILEYYACEIKYSYIQDVPQADDRA